MNFSNSSIPTHHSLRSALRQRRNAVAPSRRRIAAMTIAMRVRAARLLRAGLRVAIYHAIDGEIDVAPLACYARSVGCTLYAPQIIDMRARRMEFVPAPLGSSQPAPQRKIHRRISPRSLDVVFIPLIAFDRQGWRLGFGAGFYDRKFAFLRRAVRCKPLLVGVAYDFQRVRRQIAQPWDVFLHCVISERGLYRFRTRQSRANSRPL